MSFDLDQLVESVATAATRLNRRIVLAESCTAGLIANQLSRVPGASNWLCGSMVVYRTQTKADWLDIPHDLLDDPLRGPVSEDAARQLCESILCTTPEADIALAIVGHLGPGAPSPLDGVLYISTGWRDQEAVVSRHQLAAELAETVQYTTLRDYRQHEAANIALEHLVTLLSG